MTCLLVRFLRNPRLPMHQTCSHPTVDASTRSHKHRLVIGKGYAWPRGGPLLGYLQQYTLTSFAGDLKSVPALEIGSAWAWDSFLHRSLVSMGDSTLLAPMVM